MTTVALIASLALLDSSGVAAIRLFDRRRTIVYPSLGLLSLEAVLRQSGVEVHLIDPNLLLREVGAEEVAELDQVGALLVERVLAVAPDVVGLYTDAKGYCFQLELAQRIKRHHPECPVVFGGPHATATARATLAQFPQVDLVVLGEGERTLPALLEALAGDRPLSEVPGVVSRSSGDGAATPPALIRDLDSLPYLDHGRYRAAGVPGFYPVETGRGCPFGCTFCFTGPYWQSMPRYKSSHRILNELERLNQQLGETRFAFIHDLFTLRESFIQGFCETFFSRGLEYQWGCTTRADTISPETVATMRRAGCVAVGIGLETGSPRMQRILNKRIDLRRGMAVVKECLRQLDHVDVSLLLGHPLERPADTEMTVQLALELLQLDVEILRLNHLTAYPGTPVYAEFEDRMRFQPDCNVYYRSPLLQRRYWPWIERSKQIFGQFYLVDGDAERYLYFDGVIRLVELLFCLHKAGSSSLVQRIAGRRSGLIGLLQRWAKLYAARREEVDSVVESGMVGEMEELVGRGLFPRPDEDRQRRVSDRSGEAG